MEDTITEAMKQSGEWIPESHASEITGLSVRALARKRYAGAIRCLPSTRTKDSHGRDFWYLLEDLVELKSASGPLREFVAERLDPGQPDQATDLDGELSLRLARSYKETEVWMLRAELREQELKTLKIESEMLRAQLAQALSNLRRTQAALQILMGTDHVN